MPTIERLQNLINGEIRPPLDGQFLPKRNPVTGEIAYEIAASGAFDGVQAIQAANRAFKEWSNLKIADRGVILHEMADWIDAHRANLVAAEQVDTGGEFLDIEMQIKRAAKDVRLAADHRALRVERAVSDESIRFGQTRPYGVVAVIGSWRQPFLAGLQKIALALAAGNTVVVKPSEFAGAALHQLFTRFTKLPPGVCNLLLGLGDPVGRLLVEHPGVPVVVFHGSSAHGGEVLAAAAPLLKRVQLALNGKDTIIVMKDADLAKSLPLIARASVFGYRKILVQDDLYATFTAQLVAALKNVGPVPLMSPAHVKVSQDFFATARKEEGQILLGDGAPALNGFGLSPMLVGELTNCSEIHQNDVPGPLITINTFKYITDAVKWANNSPFGRSVSVWSKNLTQITRMVADLDFANVHVNSFHFADQRLPVGGLKASGYNTELEGEFFVKSKTVGWPA